MFEMPRTPSPSLAMFSHTRPSRTLSQLCSAIHRTVPLTESMRSFAFPQCARQALVVVTFAPYRA
ncbi:hypothetical protein C2E23DRAFT_831037 [Lenzites betulinus]|nr:hypothetical protein C2E23DRAFT_831037 [Lenzites betulinus]